MGLWPHLASTALSTVRGVKIFSLMVSWGVGEGALSDSALATTSGKSPENWGEGRGAGIVELV